ncbi:MAG TPA: aconitate hydratase AcnA [Actinomycetota bacterium]|nr:aconitate hydratase AcnA [Actinomycetota bacterium]
MSPSPLSYDAHADLETRSGSLQYYRLASLADGGMAELDRIPMTVKVLLENVMRLAETEHASEDEVALLANWGRGPLDDREFSFAPARVLLQDFTGVPAVVDLAAMRAAMQREGGDPSKVDPQVPVDLVVDHSVQVDAFGTDQAFGINVAREYERNHERYSLLRWAQQAFAGFSVVPPGMGIVHQVNLEHLAKVVQTLEVDGRRIAVPDTLVGTDSHTPMVNGLSVLGWGVGGIEAEAAMLGQPIPLVTPKVVGFRMTGELPTGVTATDLVLTVTEILRKHGVVGKFVEFYGQGLSSLAVADRATLSNMSPEFGATASLWPVDDQTVRYLRLTGRDEDLVDLVERYAKEQGMFRTDATPDPTFTETIELDLATVEPSLAGPRRPQDRVTLPQVWKSFTDVYPVQNEADGRVGDGSVVIAAITSCTNTSNPSVMLAAALVAKKAVERGLHPKPWVKTSMAPGSRVVTGYLEGSGLLPYLDKLGFNVVGYGCTTCIGNSGPLPDEVAARVDAADLAVVSVLSGNRNFEGRIHPQVKASYLASPPLVVAYALAGTASIDLSKDPLGHDPDGEPVYLRDLWPTSDEVTEALAAVRSELFTSEYARVYEGTEDWKQLPSPTGRLYEWDPDSTYVREPPFFSDLGETPPPIEDITGARVLAKVGDSVTTDHISPAGAFAPASPAGKYLIERGVEPRDFNSYGSRRGNHEVMMRGTFASIRLRNELAGREGGFTAHLPDGEVMTIFDAAIRYQEEGIPTIVLAGKEYGSGSSRDWAAKGPRLQGVRAVIAESYERIHRSNLVGMGILPLQYANGATADSLGLTGYETFDIAGLNDLRPHAALDVTAHAESGDISFAVECRIDSDVELEYYEHGGVLQMVLRRMLASS